MKFPAALARIIAAVGSFFGGRKTDGRPAEKPTRLPAEDRGIEVVGSPQALGNLFSLAAKPEPQFRIKPNRKERRKKLAKTWSRRPLAPALYEARVSTPTQRRRMREALALSLRQERQASARGAKKAVRP